MIKELLGNEIWKKGVWLLFERFMEWLRLELKSIGLGFIGIMILIRVLLFLVNLMVFMVFMNFCLILFLILSIIFLLLLGMVRLKYL